MREETMRELDGPLRQAVEQVHNRPIPKDALATTLDRVRNQRPAAVVVSPPRPTPRRRRWSRVLAISVVLMAWIGAAGAFAVQDWNESQRRLMAANNLRQLGLAIHSYHEGYEYVPNMGYVRGISENTVEARDVAKDASVSSFHRPQFFDPPAKLRLPSLEHWPRNGTIAGLGPPEQPQSVLWGRRHAAISNKFGEASVTRKDNDVEIQSAAPPTDVARAEAVNVQADLAKRTFATVDNQRVIHTAEISLVTQDVLDLEQELRELLEQFEGYTAEAQVNQPQGDLRSARWVVRVPVAKFTAFLDAAAGLGIPEYRRANAQDVTEEYVDVQARIANQKKLEQRLLDLLAERDGDLKDVIAVEQQLNVIRGQIEQSEGRQKYLEHQTDLATAVIIAREESQYVPPQARGIGSEVRLAWTNSLDALGRFGKGLVVTAVAGGPWLVLAAIPLVLVVRWFRRWRQRRAAKASV